MKKIIIVLMIFGLCAITYAYNLNLDLGLDLGGGVQVGSGIYENLSLAGSELSLDGSVVATEQN